MTLNEDGYLEDTIEGKVLLHIDNEFDIYIEKDSGNYIITGYPIKSIDKIAELRISINKIKELNDEIGVDK